jgi:hypothetical protein
MVKTTEEIVERMFEVEMERNIAKGTMRWNDLNVEYQTLKWVVDAKKPQSDVACESYLKAQGVEIIEGRK